MSKKERKAEIWFSEGDTVEWNCNKLKPTEIIALGAILQEVGLHELGEIEEIKKKKKGD